jgi:hypothetical protein
MNITNTLYLKPAVVNGTAVPDQRLTVAGTSLPFATAFHVSTTCVLVDVQTAGVYVTFDGSAATTSNGHYLAPGTSYTWSRSTAAAANFIREGATSAAVQASEFQV